MTKRRKNGVDVLFDVLVVAPWWVGPIFAAVAFAMLRFLPFVLFSDPAPAAPGEPVVVNFHAPLRTILTGLAPWAAVLILVIWAVSLVRKMLDAGRLDRQTGIESIRELPWDQFEELLVEAYRRRGYAVSRTGTSAGDGGVDLVLNTPGGRTLVQCKQWKAWKVGVQTVRELRGVMATEGADAGVVVTSGRFTREAKAFAARSGVELIDGAELAELVRAVQKDPSPASMFAAVGADKPYTSTRLGPRAAPTSAVGVVPPPLPCPLCGAPMMQRTARRGQFAGKSFLGCTGYPACTGKR